MNRNSKKPEKTVDDFLKTLSQPTSPSEKEWMLDVAERLAEGEFRFVEPSRTAFGSGENASRRGSSGWWRIAFGVAALILAVVFAVSSLSRVWLSRDVLATIDDGRAIHANESVTTPEGVTTLLSLKDGSILEIGANAHLTIERAADGLRVNLSSGNVIVTAAKQRGGHLYVQTRDCLASVVGTVFTVSATPAGSKVFVIEGKVRVQDGGNLQMLWPGQQVSTSPDVERLPLSIEIGWSRNLGAHLALLEQSTSLPAGVQTSPVETASVQGSVVKAGTNEGLARATVVLEIDRNRSMVDFATGETVAPSNHSLSGDTRSQLTVVSDETGKFTFAEVLPGRYRLWATRTGYLTSEYGQSSTAASGSPVILVSRQEVQNVRIVMTAGGIISGRIQDPGGDPLQNVTVRALKFAYRNGERLLTRGQEAKTNDLGEYRLTGLQPGRYTVSVVPPDETSLPRGKIYVPSYYPGVVDIAASTPISISAGATFPGANLTLIPMPSFRLRGRVDQSKAVGAPAGNSMVRLMPLQSEAVEGTPSRSVRTGEGGTFEFPDVVAGTYDLVAAIGGKVTGGVRAGEVFQEVEPRFAGVLRIDVSQDMDNIVMPLQPGFDIPVRITIEGVRDPNAPRIAPVVALRSRSALTALPPTINPETPTVLRSVAPGEYQLTVGGLPRGTYVKSARLEGIDALNSRLLINGPQQGNLEIVVGTDSGALDATVLDDRQLPSKNATVVLIPDVPLQNRHDLYRAGSTDDTGRVRLEAVAPGNYKAFSFKEVEADAWQDPSFLRKYEGRARSLRVSEGKVETLELRVLAN